MGCINRDMNAVNNIVFYTMLVLLLIVKDIEKLIVVLDGCLLMNKSQ